jgi:glyoxylase-like metal-dependent hydrolase (beta-lactamase superfamily II)
MVRVIDLQFQGHPGTIAAFLLETSEGPVLVESGPATTWNALEEGIHQAGYAVEDVRHLLLTHIHFDHAGAAWRLAERGARVYVHPFGVEHLADPEVLWKSAKRVFGDEMESLWGEMRAIPRDQIHACEDGEKFDLGGVEFTAWHTPGHAKHHLAWGTGEAIFTGDVGGVRLRGGPVQPPCPPPDIDLEDWNASIARLRDCPATTLYLTHFGAVTDVEAHWSGLEAALASWFAWIGERLSEAEPAELVAPFEDFVNDTLRASGLSEEAITDYQVANPPFMSVNGIARCLRRKPA